MPVPLKKIRRRHSAGELTVEQTRDAAVIATMLDRSGSTVPTDFRENAECFLVAYSGDDPVGIAGLETEVDVALMYPLFVLEKMRRRGIGSSLVRAVRMAAHTRGARMLYAPVPAIFVSYFGRFGFVEISVVELIQAFGQRSPLQKTWLDEMRAWCAVHLDISRDGLIER